MLLEINRGLYSGFCESLWSEKISDITAGWSAKMSNITAGLGHNQTTILLQGGQFFFHPPPFYRGTPPPEFLCLPLSFSNITRWSILSPTPILHGYPNIYRIECTVLDIMSMGKFI